MAQRAEAINVMELGYTIGIVNLVNLVRVSVFKVLRLVTADFASVVSSIVASLSHMVPGGCAQDCPRAHTMEWSGDVWHGYERAQVTIFRR